MKNLTNLFLSYGENINMIKASDVSFAYRNEDENISKPAISDLSLYIKKGEFISILGRNGSGKSTLAKLFNALLVPGKGCVVVHSYDTRNKAYLWDIRKTVGMVFQNPDNQIIGTTVEEDVAFGPENMGIPSPDIRKRVDSALMTVGLESFSDKEPHMLSGGQKQRTAIAGILAIKPEVIVLDEATSMLDPLGRREIMDVIGRLNRDEGITIINITHIMEETIASDRVIILDDGKLIFCGKPKEVFRNVDRIRSFGLDVPQITRLFHELRKSGVDLPDDIITAEEGINCIKDIFNEDRSK
jgi:energy-coupling factor transport system ATP-binding protein